MQTALQPVAALFGVWKGAVEGEPAELIRCQFEPALFGTMIRVQLEQHGPAMLAMTTLCVGPSQGGLCAAGHSTVHGNMIMEKAQDDAAILTLIGRGGDGTRMTLTLVAAGLNEIQLTLARHDPTGVAADSIQTAILSRALPAPQIAVGAGS